MTAICMTTALPEQVTDSGSATGGIVVGIDFSRESFAALETAAHAARRRNLPLHALCMIPALPAYRINPGSDSSHESIEQLRVDLKVSELEDMMGRVGKRASWTTECRVGPPVRGIVELAEARHAELIVVGRHHHGIVDTFLGNETTLNLMRTAATPVLAVSAPIENPQRVIAAVDFSAASITSAKYALSMMQSGTFSLCYVEPSRALFPEGFPVPYDDSFPGDIAAAFHALIATLDAPDGVRIEQGTISGQPAESLLNSVERIQADLIALGSHGHSPLGRLVLGSVSSSVTKRAKCAVLVAPALTSTR
jgi:nucleotide-binding universal stress UspA family protein